MISSYSLYGIIGSPLGHSLSPFLHTQSFKDHGMNAILMPWDIKSNDLSSFFNAFRLLNIRGCCVTLPHKSAILPFVDKLSMQAQQVGAANTLYYDSNLLCAENTDVDGFISPLNNHSFSTTDPILILGAGGAARAVIVGLQKLNCSSIFITSRSNHSANSLALEFGINAIDWDKRQQLSTQFIINTTPLGMLNKYVNETPYESAFFHQKGGIAYDIVYQPVMTRFLTESKMKGWKIITGFDMFIEQANKQHQLWTNRNLTENAKTLTKQKLVFTSTQSST